MTHSETEAKGNSEITYQGLSHGVYGIQSRGLLDQVGQQGPGILGGSCIWGLGLGLGLVSVSFFGSFRVRAGVRVRFWLGPGTRLDLDCFSSSALAAWLAQTVMSLFAAQKKTTHWKWHGVHCVHGSHTHKVHSRLYQIQLPPYLHCCSSWSQ